MSYKIIDLPALGRPFNATDIIEVSENGTGSYKANIGDFTLGGENYIFVNSNGTPAQNGQAVRDAYTAAQAMTPNGAAISYTNRVVILLAPGYYSFNEAVSGALLINTSFIDFISITGQPDVYFSSIQVLSTFASPINIFLVGIDTTKNNYYPHAAFAVTTFGVGGENITVKNCVGGNYSFSSFSIGFSGLYENCIGGDYSFCTTGNATTPPAGILSLATGNFSNYGVIKNCTSGEYSFLSGSDVFPGTISNYGNIHNCKSSLGNSFCTSSFRAANYGVIQDCEGGNYSFCIVIDNVGTGSSLNAGSIINCQVYLGPGFCIYLGSSFNSTSAENQGLISGCFSAGTLAFVINDGPVVGSNSGTIVNCFTTASMAFCGAFGINTGIIIECTAQDDAFCSDNAIGNSGQILRCTLSNGTFTVAAPTAPGRVVLGIDTTGVVNF